MYEDAKTNLFVFKLFDNYKNSGNKCLVMFMFNTDHLKIDLTKNISILLYIKILKIEKTKFIAIVKIQTQVIFSH